MRPAMSRMFAAAVLTMTVLVLPMGAEAGSGTSSASATRRVAADVLKKDCTRINGRMGYYGNPWCTPAEQDRWDRYEARRFIAR